MNESNGSQGYPKRYSVTVHSYIDNNLNTIIGENWNYYQLLVNFALSVIFRTKMETYLNIFFGFKNVMERARGIREIVTFVMR